MDLELEHIDLTELNDTELREIAQEISQGPLIASWMPREKLLAFIEDGVPLPENPVDKFRCHQLGYLVDHWKTYVTIGCHTNCYEHCDLQVTECQLSNKAWRHADFPES